MSQLIVALLGVMPKLSAIVMLMALIFYIFAVMFTQMFKGMYKEGLVEQPYFETLQNSLFTLFQMMCLDTWSRIERQIAETYTWAWIPFLLFIITSSFVVINLVIAVICDAVSVLAGLELDNEEMDDDGNPIYITESRDSDGNRVEELEEQVDELLKMQENMKHTIQLLSLQVKGMIANKDLLQESLDDSSRSR